MLCIYLTPITLPQVLTCISGSTIAQGLLFREAVKFLCKEEHVYSTIDYDHYKSRLMRNYGGVLHTHVVQKVIFSLCCKL